MTETEFHTKNLHIAAFLTASGVKLIKAVKSNNEYIFKFSPKDKAENLVNSYFLGNAICNPKDLFSKLSELKDLIFSGGTI